MRRTVTKEGKSRAWIDDESVTIAELKEKVGSLVDVHGPRANQKLLEEEFQRDVLDACSRFARGTMKGENKHCTPSDSRGLNEELRKKYSEAFAKLSTLNSQLQTLNSQLSSEDELDMLRFQVNELTEADLSSDDEDIEERHAAAAHAEDIVEAANTITEALGGDMGADRSIAKARQGIAAAAKHFPAAEEWSVAIDEIADRIGELSRSVADAASRLDIDEEEFARLDARIGVLNRLKRKYLRGAEGGGIAALVELLAKKREKLDALEHREERIEILCGEIAAQLKEVKRLGAEITKARKAAGEKFAKKVTKELRELGFAQAEFAVALEPIEPAAHGCDRVVFLFGPNPGEPMRPLASIASSGEIARVMLAIKTLHPSNLQPSTFNLQPSTLVFDEVDANIGGEIGTVVGRKLREAAAGGQVIAITHLPQSAVWGERHLVVAKAVSGGRTRTEIFPVSGERRVSEIARMLGGEQITTVVKKHAKELLGISR